jgi:transketolase
MLSRLAREKEVIMSSRPDIEQLSINTIRTLAMDAVQAANSGRPGTPMALAPVAYTLWQQFLRFDPEDPNWQNRGRFVLSADHASMLLYSLLHLTGVKAVNPKYEALGEIFVSLDDINLFSVRMHAMRILRDKFPRLSMRWSQAVVGTPMPASTGKKKRHSGK